MKKERAGLEGHLRLVCALDAEGRTMVRQQSFSAPVHFSKPYEDAGTLVVNVVNPTAGYFSGDRVNIGVEVQPGASVMLTSPSASRVHRMPAGEVRIEQEFRVSSGARLEVLPELFIPQAGARYVQRTRIEVEREGELMFFETLTPGRVASGEAFAFESLEWNTQLFHRGRLAARETYRLSPADESLEALRARFPTAYYASCFVISPRIAADDRCWGKIAEWENPAAVVGSSQLAGDGYVIKVLAAESVTLRRVLGELRRLVHRAAGRDAPVLRRF